ncbi:MAG: HupE/UreJ family protein [Candidatus Eisenbacteria bacterium]|uniref:HupE/UreJ family protein n=1 Tax=Eiseniibacteriota bacterium TaxID=2212470 RepID=A0A538T6E1_UNCEI|nr:MAG: HupE/UreJ family protein [Candidatus Eisenbacteria bacterium]
MRGALARVGARPAEPARALAVLLLIAAPLHPSHVLAHNQPYSFIDLRLDERGLQGSAAAHVVDLAHEMGAEAPDSLLRPEILDRYGARIETLLSGGFTIRVDGVGLRPRWTGIEAIPDRRNIVARFEAPWERIPGKLRLTCRLFLYDPQHITYLNVYEGGRLRHQDLLDRTRSEVDYFSGGGQGRLALIGTFVGEGIRHIFIGPDHMLFIVGLLLLGGKVRRLLKIVTAFTVAHSITLALAALGILNPSPRVIEPAIALTIACIGVENLLASRNGRDLRALIAFGFGLIHGFGFAGVLGELGLPAGARAWALFSFNGGVEAAQAVIVLSVTPLLALLKASSEAWSRRVVAMGSWCVILAGAIWFFQRMLSAS